MLLFSYTRAENHILQFQNLLTNSENLVTWIPLHYYKFILKTWNILNAIILIKQTFSAILINGTIFNQFLWKLEWLTTIFLVSWKPLHSCPTLTIIHLTNHGLNKLNNLEILINLLLSHKNIANWNDIWFWWPYLQRISEKIISVL